jgi:membrane fusion protein (multidrug efflux system)
MADHTDVIENEAPARERDVPRAEVAQRDVPAKQDKPPAEPPEAEKTKKRSPWGLIILGVVIVLAAIGGALYWYGNRNLQSTDDAYTDGRAITIIPQVKGDVVALLVNDNQFVHAGDVLIKIDPRDYIAARDQAQGTLELAQAQLANARINLQTVRITAPAKLAAARAQLDTARAVQVNAEADYRRQHSVNPAATTRQNIDQANSANQQATAQVANADAQLRQADTVDQAIASAQAQVKQWEGEVAEDQAKLDAAEIDLSRTIVTAPQDGWITRRNVEMGNYVQPGGSIFSLVTPQVWVTANFKETELTRMRPGQHVAIRVDAYPGLRLEGHVDSVQLGSGSKFSAFPAENATGNYIKIVQRVPVKIDIDSGLDPNLPLPLGISVEPTVQLQ